MHSPGVKKFVSKEAAKPIKEYIIVEHTEEPTSKNIHEETDPQKAEDRKLAICYQKAKLRVKVLKKFMNLKSCFEFNGSLPVFRFCHR